MPIRWYGPANPEEPTYRHFERIVNLTLHAALFSALNSGLWVVQELRHPLALYLKGNWIKLELALADRLYVHVAGWHLYLGDAGLAQTLAIECAARIDQGADVCARQALEAVQVAIGGGATRLPLARLSPAGQLRDLEEVLEPFCR